MKKWKVRIIHLSHSDVGYKDIQTKIIKQQNVNLKNVVDELTEHKESNAEFKWNVECFGTVESFIKDYPSYKDKFVKLVHENKIGISGNYWNYSKLPGRELIASSFKRVSSFAKDNNIEVNSLVTNDVNGYAASWAEEAYDNGMKNLFFGLHTYHGFYPAFRKQYPFWWKLPNGNKVFVWIGENYGIGNNMGIIPGFNSDYIAKDGISISGDDVDEQIELANKRISEYVEDLERDGYPFEVIPFTVLGTGSDNDPANFNIPERLNLLAKEWKQFGVEEVTMVTLDEFFSEIQKNNTDIPTYEGEWPDWWTDGVASAPHSLRAFREAQRNYKSIKRVAPNTDLNKIENDLLIYSEHTYGTEDPVRHPHSQYNFSVEKIKQTFAFNALNDSLMAIDHIINWTSYKVKDDLIVKLNVQNPFDVEVTKSINITRYLGLSEASKFLNNKAATIKDSMDNVIDYSIMSIPHAVVEAWAEKIILMHVNLGPKEIKEVIVTLSDEKQPLKRMTSSFDTLTSDMANDVSNINNPKKGISFRNNILETKHFTIKFDQTGIKQIFSKEFNKNILVDDIDKLFVPIYFVEKALYSDRNKLFTQRRHPGKNRLSNKSQRHDAKFLYKDVKISETLTDVEIRMNYEIESTKFYEVIITLSDFNKRIETVININKDTEWSMENFFISLPFKGKLKLDYDNLYEPYEEQIAGTLVDYHSIQEGLVFDDNILVSQLDAALVWNTNFVYGERPLAHGEFKIKTHGAYTWAFNNVWETNFPADTSGMHSFRYVIEVANVKNKSERLLANSSPLLLSRVEQANEK